MNFQMLTAIQVQNLCNPVKTRRVLPVKKPRGNKLACYVPNGDLQSSRRVTGAGLDPDSTEMVDAALYFATGLHRSTVEMIGDPADQYRSLIGPLRYSDRILAKYCNVLIKGALGPFKRMSTHDAVSPLIVPYLLGGIPTKNVEDLCYRALEVMDFFGDGKTDKKHDLQRAIGQLGFGPGVHHGEPVEELTSNPYNHISKRQHFLLNLPSGDYAKRLLQLGAFGESLYRQISGFKDDVIKHAETCLNPTSGEMTELAAKDRFEVWLDDLSYWRAVGMVFCRPWAELDLDGRIENHVADGEVLMARNIISRISDNDRLTAEALVGMSLLTGISLGNWTRYAILDHTRRGTTFVTSIEVDKARELVEVSPHYSEELEGTLRKDASALRELERAENRWHRKLMSPNHPLWSTSGSFYLERYNAAGVPIYKHKPFSLGED